MITRKYIIVGMYQAVLERDISLINKDYVFDTEEDLLIYAKDKYRANPTQIALIEGEVYGNNSWDKQLRDIKEFCGLRKDLEQELKKLRDLEFKQMMKVANELTNRAEKSESDYYKLQCGDKYV
jgi:hypothetical protein